MSNSTAPSKSDRCRRICWRLCLVFYFQRSIMVLQPSCRFWLSPEFDLCLRSQSSSCHLSCIPLMNGTKWNPYLVTTALTLCAVVLCFMVLLTIRNHLDCSQFLKCGALKSQWRACRFPRIERFSSGSPRERKLETCLIWVVRRKKWSKFILSLPFLCGQP